ncbi:HNH endonuclease [Streptomyces sp. ISL-12]|nr:HNH endonuclease [Streptomyces sp. ISL-12]
MAVAEVDHIRPLARGGLHEWPNLAPACAWCNRSKGDRDVIEWLSRSTGEGLTGDNRAITEGDRGRLENASQLLHEVTSS